jgi:uncharacterized membrane protein
VAFLLCLLGVAYNHKLAPYFDSFAFNSLGEILLHEMPQDVLHATNTKSCADIAMYTVICGDCVAMFPVVAGQQAIGTLQCYCQISTNLATVY